MHPSISGLLDHLARLAADRPRDDRGDVPGWVMVTLMTAIVVAALTHDPEKASGLDGALKSLADLPFGTFILWLVGAGLIIYGVYCFARARYARV